MSEVLLAKAADSFLSLFKRRFTASVIERWSTYRAERFLESFVVEVERELLLGEPSGRLTEQLDKLVGDDRSTEALFDGYRRVALSRSRDYGPRIIVFLTAQLIAEKRRATVADDRIFDAAEDLTDSELVDSAKFLERHLERARTNDEEVGLDDSGLRVEAGSDDSCSHLPHRFALDRSRFDLDDWFGPWAIKLCNFGVIRELVKEESWDYDLDLDRSVEPGTATKATWSTLVPTEFLVLRLYIRKALEIAL